MWSIILKEVEIFKVLINSKTNIEAKTTSKQNILHFLLSLMDDNTKTPLSGQGGNQFKGSGTDLDVAKQFIRIFYQRIFSNKSNVDSKQASKLFVKLLSQQDSYGWTPIHVGALTDRFAELPIQSRLIPVNALDLNGCNALHVAAWNGSFATLRKLLRGPGKKSWQPALKINLPTKLGMTPLDLAASNAHIPTIMLMLKFGCYLKHHSVVNGRSCLDFPPQALLHLLILHSSIDSLQGLLVRDENRISVDEAAIQLAASVKHSGLCTFNITSFTNPMVQYMYSVPLKNASQSSHISFDDKGFQTYGGYDVEGKDKNSVDEKLVCLMCREKCYPQQTLRRVVDHRIKNPMYCQCDKASCACLTPTIDSSASPGSPNHSIVASFWRPAPIDVAEFENVLDFQVKGTMYNLAMLLAQNQHRFICTLSQRGGRHRHVNTLRRAIDVQCLHLSSANGRWNSLRHKQKRLMCDQMRNILAVICKLKFNIVVQDSAGHQKAEGSLQNHIQELLKQEDLEVECSEIETESDSEKGKPSLKRTATDAIKSPVSVAEVILTVGMNNLAEIIAIDLHERWCSKRIAQGWVYSPESIKIGTTQYSPFIAPFSEMPKRYCRTVRQFCRATIKTLMAWNFRVEPPAVPGKELRTLHSKISFKSSTSVTRANTRNNSNVTVQNKKSIDTDNQTKREIRNQIMTLFLHRLARDGAKDSRNNALAELVVQHGAYINAVDSYKHSALYIAVKRGHIEMTKTLMRLKASIESKDSAGMSPLAIASYLGNRLLCRLLLHNRADTQSFDTRWFSPLHHAAMNGHADVCKLLCAIMLQRKGSKDRDVFVSSIQPDSSQHIDAISEDYNSKINSKFQSVRKTSNKSSVLVLNSNTKHQNNNFSKVHPTKLVQMQSSHQGPIRTKIRKQQSIANDTKRINSVVERRGSSAALSNDYKHYQLLELKRKREEHRLSAPTPLILSVLSGHSSVVEVLIEYGLDPIYVYSPSGTSRKNKPQSLSAYEHALLEFRNAREEWNAAVADDGTSVVDDVNDGGMVEVVIETRWKEISTIIKIFNNNEKVKRVRVWYAWNAFLGDGIVNILFYLIIWLLTSASPGYGSATDRRLVFAMQNTLADAFNDDKLNFQSHWLDWFHQVFVQPFPIGLINEIDKSQFADTLVASMTPPGMLYDSQIMFLGDVRMSRRRTVALDRCPYIDPYSSASDAPELVPRVDIELQNHWYPPVCFRACDDPEQNAAKCFYENETKDSEIKLQSWNATQRSLLFEKVIANGYINNRTSRVYINALLWNPDTAYIFLLKFETDFEAGGVVDTSITFDGLQLNEQYSPSIFFMIVLLLNIVWLFIQICARGNQKQVVRRMANREGYKSQGNNSCSRFSRYAMVQCLLIVLLMGVIIADLAAFTIGRKEIYTDTFAFAEHTEDINYEGNKVNLNSRQLNSEVMETPKSNPYMIPSFVGYGSGDRKFPPRWLQDEEALPSVSDAAYSRIETMLLINQYENQLLAIVLLLMGFNVLYNLRLIPFLGNVILAVLSTVVDQLVLCFLLIWMLANFFFAVSFHSIFASMTVQHKSIEDSWFYTLFSGLDWEVLFGEWDIIRKVGDSGEFRCAHTV